MDALDYALAGLVLLALVLTYITWQKRRHNARWPGSEKKNPGGRMLAGNQTGVCLARRDAHGSFA